MNAPRTIEGQWRIFGSRSRAYIGTLNYDPNDGLELVVNFAHNRGLAGVFRGMAHRRRRCPHTIHGLDANGCPVTLFGCSVVESNLSAGFEKYTIRPLAAILGDHFDTWARAACSTVDVRYSLLDNWLFRPVTTIDQTPDGGLAYHPQHHPDLVVPLAGGACLTITHSKSFNESVQMVEIRQQHFIRFSFPHPISLKAANDNYVSPFRNFFTLLTNSKVFVDSVKFSREHQNPDLTPLELLVSNHNVEKADRETLSPHMLVPYADIATQLAQIIPAWFVYYRDMESIISLYFAAIWSNGIPDTTQFLLLAQALEAYHSRCNLFSSSIQSTASFRSRVGRILEHIESRDEKRWLKEKLQHANQKTLAQRLKDLMSRNDADLARFIRKPTDFRNKIRNTRNYYTHFDETLRRSGKIATGRELAVITFKMRALLLIFFLRDLRLPQTAIDRVVNRMRSISVVSLDA